jgi:hypothetical protein
MSIQDRITAALTDYGIGDIAFFDIGGGITAIRITDDNYEGRSGMETVQMIGHEIVARAADGISIMATISNALYDTDDKRGAAILIRGL